MTTVTCALCRAEVLEIEAKESVREPGRFWCIDDWVCVQRWMKQSYKKLEEAA